MYSMQLIISSFAILISTWLIPGVEISEPKFFNALLVAIVIAVLNTFLKPVLIMLTIKVTILSFGIFLLIINAFIILLTSEFIGVFVINSFWTAIVFSVILSIVTFLLETFGRIKIIKYKN
ncbi:MAG: phage holin family protein [Bacteroidales bacterium]|jgi:putative membrane protein|nr:phage holin family protein [Bacteroidales bacterium]